MKFQTIGSDPEFFVRDHKNKPYPAILFAKGTKTNPSKIEGAPGFYEQRDNLSFEGNVPPAKTKEEFIYNISYLREYFEGKVGRVGYSISPNGVEYFESRYRNTPEGREFGCSTVVSAWDSDCIILSERPTPVLNKDRFRVAGFHIHIGYSESRFTKSISDLVIARLFDLFLTMPSQEIKAEPERINTYGKYGMIRCKSYGVECRTLSAFFAQKGWLSWIWDQLMRIEDFINECDPKDLIRIALQAYFLGYHNEGMKRRVFAPIFRSFKNTDILVKYVESREIYEKYKKESDANSNLKRSWPEKCYAVSKDSSGVFNVSYIHDYTVKPETVNFF